MRIFIDNKPYSVTDHYKRKGFEKLPPTLTMTGMEMRVAADRCNDTSHYLIDDKSPCAQAYSDSEAVVLSDGARFSFIPPATYFPNSPR